MAMAWLLSAELFLFCVFLFSVLFLFLCAVPHSAALAGTFNAGGRFCENGLVSLLGGPTSILES